MNDNTIPGLATFGFVVFLGLSTTGVYAHINRDKWQAVEAERIERADAMEANRAAQAAAAEARAQQAAREAAAEQLRAEAAAKYQRIADCETSAEEISRNEAQQLTEMLAAYSGSCASSFGYRVFRPGRRRMLQHHDAYAKLRTRCAADVVLTEDLNQRSRAEVDSWSCEILKTIKEARQPVLIDASATAPPEPSTPSPHAPTQAVPTLSSDERLQDIIAGTRTAANVANEPTEIAWSDFRWRRSPSAEEQANALPANARKSDYPAEAVLNCVVLSKGELDCTLTSVSPEGKGFDKAALKIARRFRAEPLTIDGRKTTGANTTLHIVFEPPE